MLIACINLPFFFFSLSLLKQTRNLYRIVMRRGAVYFILPKCRPMMSLRSRYLIITTRLNDTRLRFELYNHGTTRTYIRPVNTFKSSRPNIRLHDHFDVDSNSLYLGEDKIPNVFYFFLFFHFIQRPVHIGPPYTGPPTAVCLKVVDALSHTIHNIIKPCVPGKGTGRGFICKFNENYGETAILKWGSNQLYFKLLGV